MVKKFSVGPGHIRWRFAFCGYEWKGAVAVKRAHGMVSGVRNLTADGMYILMADYDDQDPSVIEYELRAVQRHYGLGPVVVVESSPGKWHAVCFSKIDWGTYREIIDQLHCDPAYQLSKSPILRTSAKGVHVPHVHHVITNQFEAEEMRELSLGHLRHYADKIVGFTEAIGSHIMGMPVDKEATAVEVRYST